MGLHPKIRYFLLPLILGSWGCLLLKLYLSGQLRQVQNPAYHSITLYFSGILLFGSIAYPVFFDLPSSEINKGSLRFLGQSFLLFLPVAAYLSLPEDLITTSFLRQRSSFNILGPGALQRFLPGKPGELHRLLLEQVQTVTKQDVVPLDLLELIYLSQDAELRQRYNGQQVSIPGQWLSEDAGHFKIARLLIFCCAADGRTLTLRVHGKTDLTEDGVWIEVTGTLHFNEDQPIPELDLGSLIRTEGPPDAGM